MEINFFGKKQKMKSVDKSDFRGYKLSINVKNHNLELHKKTTNYFDHKWDDNSYSQIPQTEKKQLVSPLTTYVALFIS